jgi:hypothetical protein
MNPQIRAWLPPFRLPEKMLAAALLLWITSWFGGSTNWQLVTWLAATGLSALVGMRLGRFYLGKLIWRLRNRLLVAFLFVGVLPIALVLAFASIGTAAFAGQLAVYFAHSKLDERLEALQSTADAIARAESGGYSKLRAEIEASFPGAQTSIEPGQATGAGDGIGGGLSCYQRRHPPRLGTVGSRQCPRHHPHPAQRRLFRLARSRNRPHLAPATSR